MLRGMVIESQGYNRSVHGLQLFVEETRKGMAESRDYLSALAQNLRTVVGEMAEGGQVTVMDVTATLGNFQTSIDRGFLQRTAEDLEYMGMRFPELLLEMASSIERPCLMRWCRMCSRRYSSVAPIC